MKIDYKSLMARKSFDILDRVKLYCIANKKYDKFGVLFHRNSAVNKFVYSVRASMKMLDLHRSQSRHAFHYWMDQASFFSCDKNSCSHYLPCTCALNISETYKGISQTLENCDFGEILYTCRERG